MQAPRRDKTYYRGYGQTDVEGCCCLELVVVAALAESLNEAAFAYVARIAEVKTIEADTADVFSNVEVQEVLVTGADDQAGSAPQ